MIDSTASDEMAFVRTLRSLGVSQNLAAAVTYLAWAGEATAKEVQDQTGISQPGVSKSMKALRGLGWLDVREIKAVGNGRLRKAYALNISLEEVGRHFEAQKLQESAQAMKSIERLREVV